MSVTNYTPNIDNGCAYAQGRLKNVVYFVSKAHLKDVHIDNGQAYIDGLTEAPTRLDCFSIQFEENETLDERYRFTKSLRFSVGGYMNLSYFTGSDLYYAIIETEDGTPYMINVDFPSKITYTYNLSANVDQTDFTFSTQSNFPSLRVATQMVRDNVCKPYRTNGIESLKLIEKNYTALAKDGDTVTVYTYQGKQFSIIDYMRDTCSLTESYDGEKVTDAITFDIGFDNYKTSWHYNLLEFLDNLYAARIVPKSHTNEFFVGFDLGLQPSYSITADDTNGQTDKITVTLVDSTSKGLVALNDYEEEHHTVATWAYIKSERQYVTYECMGEGVAKYLVQKEFNANGYPTGRYKVMQGYQEQFAGIGDIIETFTNVETFYEPSCSTQQCYITSDIPNTISFTSVTCNTYSLISTCSWSISNVPSFATVSPMTGNANQQYTISVCNTASTFDGRSGTFTINSGTNKRNVTLVLNPPSNILTPTAATINCLSQNVTFTYNSACAIRVTSIDDALSYHLTNSSLIVTTPRNDSTANTRTYSITVTDCNGKTQTVVITQDKTYERWVNTTGYLCVDDDSFTRQLRYTGTTASDINTPTGEYRPGTLIQEGDERCSTITTKWGFEGHYYCINGQKTECWEQWIRYGQGEWQKTGVTKLGSAVEDTDGFCDQEAIYSWRQSIKWQCGA